MSNLVELSLEEYAKSRGFRKHSGAWYLRGDDTILVLELQKSEYAERYYLNVAVWFVALGSEAYPQERRCHVRTRLSRLAPNPSAADDHLDVNHLAGIVNGPQQLRRELERVVDSVITVASSVRSLAGPAGVHVLANSLVTGPAQALLADNRG